MMHSQRTIFWLSLMCYYLAERECLKLDEKFTKLIDGEWQCDTICIGSGGHVEYHPENNVCKCTLNKNIDDTEVELMLKNAQNLGLTLVTVEPLSPETNGNKKIKKRETKPTSPNPNGIVGQRAPRPRASRPTPRSWARQNTSTRRAYPINHLPISSRTTRRPTTTYKANKANSNSDQQKRMQQIQARLTELRQQRRNRPGPHLQQRSGFKAEETHQSLLEKLRQKQQERKVSASTFAPRLGAALTSTTAPSVPSSKPVNNSQMGKISGKAQESHQVKNDKPVVVKQQNVVAVEKKPKFEIITQDPSLIDGDN